MNCGVRTKSDTPSAFPPFILAFKMHPHVGDRNNDHQRSVVPGVIQSTPVASEYRHEYSDQAQNRIDRVREQIEFTIDGHAALPRHSDSVAGKVTHTRVPWPSILSAPFSEQYFASA